MKAPKEQLPPSEGQFSPTTEVARKPQIDLSILELREIRREARRQFKIKAKERYKFIK
jgi:hypothetical protein